jgi:hypothetical protein
VEGGVPTSSTRNPHFRSPAAHLFRPARVLAPKHVYLFGELDVRHMRPG